jgi:hypothetical protein
LLISSASREQASMVTRVQCKTVCRRDSCCRDLC